MAVYSTIVPISIILLALCTRSYADPQAYRLNWSSSVYGPDGPWHAVRIALGTPPQPLDLYPATWYSSWPLTSSVCRGYSKSECKGGDGGFYDPDKSSTYKEIPKRFSGVESSQFARNSYNDFGNVLAANGSVTTANDTLHFLPGSSQLSVPEAGVESVKRASFRAAGGATYPITLGYLTLGAGVATSIFTLKGPYSTFNVAYSWLFDNHIIPSPSWTLHIGSPSLNIEPSMYLGGYDQNRVIGDTLPQVLKLTDASYNNLAVNISSIAMGTVKGESPFVKGDQSNLLSAGGASTNQINIEPAVPYLFLPEETCANIAANLPVTYQADYGLYLWDVQDPRFDRIMSSSSYLSFSLKAAFSSSRQTVEIKVPFQLLNLTLSAPLSSTPIQYFPCSPVKGNGVVALGRAFLQAAFIGVNWYLPEPKSWWFVAQAPGPGYKAPSVREIHTLDHGLLGASTDWESTWSGYWDSIAMPPLKSNEPSSGLSTGAQVGIGIGVAAACIFLIGAVIFWLFKRRRRSEANTPTISNARLDSPSGTYVANSNAPTPSQQSMVQRLPGYSPSSSRYKAELEQPKTFHELAGYSSERYELPP